MPVSEPSGVDRISTMTYTVVIEKTNDVLQPQETHL